MKRKKKHNGKCRKENKEKRRREEIERNRPGQKEKQRKTEYIRKRLKEAAEKRKQRLTNKSQEKAKQKSSGPSRPRDRATQEKETGYEKPRLDLKHKPEHNRRTRAFTQHLPKDASDSETNIPPKPPKKQNQTKSTITEKNREPYDYSDLPVAPGIRKSAPNKNQKSTKHLKVSVSYKKQTSKLTSTGLKRNHAQFQKHTLIQSTSLDSEEEEEEELQSDSEELITDVPQPKKPPDKA